MIKFKQEIDIKKNNFLKCLNYFWFGLKSKKNIFYKHK